VGPKCIIFIFGGLPLGSSDHTNSLGSYPGDAPSPRLPLGLPLPAGAPERPERGDGDGHPGGGGGGGGPRGGRGVRPGPSGSKGSSAGAS